ncbi:MAG: hypothetical protein JWQ90_1999 [Hydrocarboniphaga sp.]|uniref:hypothetical protein n=1 Tax=Hydrocarboniphaga sp. TaxID=2033016 RepID=UPI0026187473|nr:hypothetical protein [Hydrocarboniphaga sp.]MDB5969549.1 hypothetical protein [Hydrocarboniphaga sp.]
MRFSFTRAVAAVTALAGACALCACSATVGDGTKPTRLYLGLTGEEAAADMSECTNVQMNAYVVFTNGSKESTGTYDTRVAWVSQNPSIVFVSDGVTASPEGTVYPAGTLVALRPGAATISATYLSLHASITVDVSELADLRIDNALTDIGEDLTQAFKLEAVVTEGQPEQDITTTGIWRFDPATSHAYVDSGTGLVHANSTTGSDNLRLVARLPNCDREVSTSFRITPVTSLAIDYFERGDASALPEGFSEAFTVNAGFADTAAPLQNVTTQTTISSIDSDYIDAVLGDDAWYVTAGQYVGNAAITLKLTTLDLLLTTKTWQIQNTELTSLVASPDDLEITYPATGQINVSGTFDNGLVMPITRHVSFASSDSTLGTIGATNDTAGEVTTTDTDGDFEVTASFTVDDEVLDDTVTVHSFAHVD